MHLQLTSLLLSPTSVFGSFIMAILYNPVFNSNIWHVLKLHNVLKSTLPFTVLRSTLCSNKGFYRHSLHSAPPHPGPSVDTGIASHSLTRSSSSAALFIVHVVTPALQARFDIADSRSLRKYARIICIKPTQNPKWYIPDTL